MIIEFKVKNFLSIRDEQVFSLAASSATELEDNIFLLDEVSPLKLVRAAVIYGANAGGKSNLLSALLFMRQFIVNSAKESQQGEKISVENFAFDEKNCQEPSEFEVTFIKQGIRYQYGFTVDENRVYEEWLFAYPSNHVQQWFSRIYDKKNDGYSWKFSKFFKRGKKFSDLTLGNVLFLSNAVKLNNEQLVPAFSWFQKDLLLLDPPRGIGYGRSIEHIKSANNKEKILKIIDAADSSIIDVMVNREMVNEENIPNFPDSIPSEVKNFFKNEMMKQEKTKINFLHSGNFSLEFHSESEGTRRVLAFAGYWLDVLENGGVLVIDELDNSLHPLMVRFLISLICNPEINKKNAQLIFTTHDTSLLDNEIFRRDQIWFVEKDKNNATQLYPLLDFSPRKHEAIGRGYLQGRYGALPYVGEWRF